MALHISCIFGISYVYLSAKCKLTFGCNFCLKSNPNHICMSRGKQAPPQGDPLFGVLELFQKLGQR